MTNGVAGFVQAHGGKEISLIWKRKSRQHYNRVGRWASVLSNCLPGLLSFGKKLMIARLESKVL
jgi:hypothetical protein